MPIVNFSELQELYRNGWTVAVPPQGINPVPTGLAEVASLDLKRYPNAQFIQLKMNDGKNQIFILVDEDSIRFAENWIHEALDHTRYGLTLIFRCYKTNVSYMSSYTSEIAYPNVSDQEFLSQRFAQLGANLIFNKNKGQASFEVHYATKVTSELKEIHTKEINEFEVAAFNLIHAISCASTFGFVLIGRDMIEPTTMYGRPTISTIGNTPTINAQEVDKYFQKLKSENYGDVALRSLSTLNSITSHRAQIVFGFEVIINLLKDNIATIRKHPLKLSKKQRRDFRESLRVWLNQWCEQNGIRSDSAHIKKLTLDPASILSDGSLPSMNSSIVAVLTDFYRGEDKSEDLIRLCKMRHAYSHNRNDEFTKEDIEESLSIIRHVLRSLAASDRHSCNLE